MKLEIEITEAEIKAAIERKIRVAIADETNSWGSDNKIKAYVKERWDVTMRQVVDECLADSPALRTKIMAAIEQKLNGQLTAMMKVK